tara:strand:- start:151 stop:264 length:114 start_codon:yes stop_codon:yes gene_type:complete
MHETATDAHLDEALLDGCATLKEWMEDNNQQKSTKWR